MNDEFPTESSFSLFYVLLPRTTSRSRQKHPRGRRELLLRAETGNKDILLSSSFHPRGKGETSGFPAVSGNSVCSFAPRSSRANFSKIPSRPLFEVSRGCVSGGVVLPVAYLVADLSLLLCVKKGTKVWQDSLTLFRRMLKL